MASSDWELSEVINTIETETERYRQIIQMAERRRNAEKYIKIQTIGEEFTVGVRLTKTFFIGKKGNQFGCRAFVLLELVPPPRLYLTDREFYINFKGTPFHLPDGYKFKFYENAVECWSHNTLLQDEKQVKILVKANFDKFLRALKNLAKPTATTTSFNYSTCVSSISPFPDTDSEYETESESESEREQENDIQEKFFITFKGTPFHLPDGFKFKFYKNAVECWSHNTLLQDEKQVKILVKANFDKFLRALKNLATPTALTTSFNYSTCVSSISPYAESDTEYESESESDSEEDHGTCVNSILPFPGSDCKYENESKSESEQERDTSVNSILPFPVSDSEYKRESKSKSEEEYGTCVNSILPFPSSDCEYVNESESESEEEHAALC